VATDPEIIVEVINEGYSAKHTCLFRDYTPLPIDMKEYFEFGDWICDFTDENTEEFFCVGRQRFDLDVEYGGLSRLMDGDNTTYLVPVPQPDHAKDLKEIGVDIIGEETGQKATYEFVGPVAVDVASKSCDEVFLIGFDFGGKPNGKINNMYAGTSCYNNPEDDENPKMPQSIREMSDIFKRYPDITYYRVGKQDLDIPYPMHSNLVYIDIEEMNNMLGLVDKNKQETTA
jgi:hypothetical protein